MIEEDAVLTEAVLNTQTATDPLGADERVVFDADQYLGNVGMDGHLLTLCNNGLERLNEMSEALERIGAQRERALLMQALGLWEQHACVGFEDAEDALRSALDEIDEQFFTAAGEDGNLETRTKHYVREHLDSFIVFE